MEQSFGYQRRKAVENLEKLGIFKEDSVKKALLKVKRELFVPNELIENSYTDTPLPIPGNMTISALHMHAIMLSAAKLKSGDKFLEIGSGSGILLAYAREIVGEKGEVFGMEINKEAFEFAKEN